MNKQREGFWYSKHEPGLPKPIPNVEWDGRKAFVTALRKLESTLEPAAYRGMSSCRLCDKRNGHEEYTSGKWTWPSGFLHYITDHGVRPSLAFEEFVVGDLKVSRPDVMEQAIDRAAKDIAAAEDRVWLGKVVRSRTRGTST